MRSSLRLFLLSFVLSSGLSIGAATAACKGPIGGRDGNCAADFALKTLDGKQVRLSDYLGKVVLLNFWATWCEPCAVEVPALDRQTTALARRSIVLLTVSIDSEGKDTIEKFFTKILGRKKPTFPVLLDSDQRISKGYGTFKVPETYVIDPTGRIRDKAEGIRDWDDSITLHYLELLSAK